MTKLIDAVLADDVDAAVYYDIERIGILERYADRDDDGCIVVEDGQVLISDHRRLIKASVALSCLMMKEV